MMTQFQFFFFFLAAIHQVVLALQRKGFGELAELGRVAKLEAVQAEALGELEKQRWPPFRTQTQMSEFLHSFPSPSLTLTQPVMW